MEGISFHRFQVSWPMRRLLFGLATAAGLAFSTSALQGQNTSSDISSDASHGPSEPVARWQRLQPYFTPPEAFAGRFGSYASVLRFDDLRPVRDALDWQERRAELRNFWMEKLGRWPALIEQPNVEVLSESMREDFLQKRVRVEIALRQKGEGWLLVPQRARPLPAILVLFYEPETSVGLKREGQHLDFGLELARQGFVTLSIGTPGGDARKPDLGSAVCQPLSYHAYVAANCYRALASMPEVDPRRVGVVGHSYGGKWSLFAGALCDQFAAIATSDPGIVFDESRSNVNYWEPWYLGASAEGAQRKPGMPNATNPRAGAYAELVASHRDLHELHALIAPRPLLVSGGSEDPPERWQALNRTIEVNDLLGKRHRVGMSNRPEHAPNAESNAVLIDFFVHFLGVEAADAVR